MTQGYPGLLKDCAKSRDLFKGYKLHLEILEKGILPSDVYVGSSLVNMYAKCGALPEAQDVFDELNVRDTISWNALISGYAQQGHGKKAFTCLKQMQQDGIYPNAITFLCVLKACSCTELIEKGKVVHNEIVRKGLFAKDIMLGTALVDMYARCGMLEKAEDVVMQMPVRDVVCWTSLIAGYVQHGQAENAFDCLHRMRNEGISPNSVTFIHLLKACVKSNDVEKGQHVHDMISRYGLLAKDIRLGNALVDMYTKCGALVKARDVLNEFPVRDLVTWTTVISGYAQQGQVDEALGCLQSMQDEGLSPNGITFTCILKACSNTFSIEAGEQIHNDIVRLGLLREDLFLGNALVDMYAKCGKLAKAEMVLRELPVRDVVSWNALITGYAQQGQVEEALNHVGQMENDGFSPDDVTYICILKACAEIGDIQKGKQIHENLIRKELLLKNSVIHNALVDMYVKCGALLKAEQVINELPLRDVVTWNSVIAGHAHHGQSDKAIYHFEHMKNECLLPDAVTFISILKCCGHTGVIEKGKQFHCAALNSRLLVRDIILSNGLIDMYAKCGLLTKAEQVFQNVLIPNAESWNALITGYAQHGQVKEAFSCFNCMLCEGIHPDAITCLSIFNACSHTGLLDDGLMQFLDMSKYKDILPSLDHQTCMVDLFGRAGCFDKAMEIIKNNPCDYPRIWSVLLVFCQKWGNLNLGMLAFEQAQQVDVNNSATYVLMGNIYTNACMN